MISWEVVAISAHVAIILVAVAVRSAMRSRWGWIGMVAGLLLTAIATGFDALEAPGPSGPMLHAVGAWAFFVGLTTHLASIHLLPKIGGGGRDAER